MIIYLPKEAAILIGRLQVEKCISVFVQAQNVTYFIVHGT